MRMALPLSLVAPIRSVITKLKAGKSVIREGVAHGTPNPGIHRGSLQTRNQLKLGITRRPPANQGLAMGGCETTII